MAWLAADEFGEYIFLEKPKRSRHEWHVDDLNKYAELGFGELHRLLGRALTFEDEPVGI